MQRVNARRSAWRAAACIAMLLCLIPAQASAQIDSGTINGTISDETKGALPGVTVTTKNLANGQVRSVLSGPDGRYLIAALPPGKYSVTAELQGFGTVLHPEISVNVGSAVDINVEMKVATIEETVTVTGAAPLIESTNTDLSNVITLQELEALPSRNRDYLDFTLLTAATSENVSSANGTGVAVGGARSKEGALLVDGFYNLDISFVQPKQRHSQDLVQEFQVVTFGGSAEYGRAIGGIINVVTKSGTNRLGGSSYGFFRSSKLNATDFSQKAVAGEKSPYDRQQWGGTAGGPLKKDKSFFLGSFEHLSENLPTNTGIRQQDIAAIGLPQEASLMPRAMRSNFVFGKWDHNISNNKRLQFSFSFTRQVETTSWNFSLTTRSRWYELRPDDYVFAGKYQANSEDGKKLHEIKVSYFPRFYTVYGQQMPGQPLCDCTLNPQWPNPPNSPPKVSITGVASFGSAGLDNYFNTFPVQSIYTSTVFTDNHAVKFGADWLYAPVNYERYDQLLGNYSFASLQAFQTRTYSQYTQSFGESRLPRTFNMFSSFVQDSWRVTPRMTLNYGVRYDLDFPVKHWRSGDPFGKTDYNNFGPRFALSYDVTGQNTTYLKLTSGVYYDRIWGNDSLNMFIYKNDPLRVQATWRPTDAGAPVYPQVFATPPAVIPRGVVDAMIMPDSADTPTNAQVVGTFEHMITRNLAFMASGVFTKSWYKQVTLDTNLVWNPALNAGAGGYGRPDSNYRRVTQLQLIAPAQYVGGIIELEQRGARAGVTGNLTVSRSGGVESINDLFTYQQQGFDPDYGPQPDSPAVRGTLSGYFNVTPAIQVSGAFRARTGLPVNANAAGLDLNGDGVLGDRTPGMEAYSFRAPANNSLDLRLTWSVPIGQTRKVQVYAESYNVLNHENVRTVLNDFGPNPSAAKNRWLEPNLWFPPREVQLGLRLSF
jgi:hypothetical protein